MSWTEIASEFAWDGSLRDIYVVGTTLGDWQRILDSLLERDSIVLVFSENGEKIPIPPIAKFIFERRGEAAMMLEVTVGNIRVNCHFFCEEQVEFDIDPRDVRDEEDFEVIADFMSILADATGKPAILTHENIADAVILTMQPRG
jgi:hypothetical protein